MVNASVGESSFVTYHNDHNNNFGPFFKSRSRENVRMMSVSRKDKGQ